MRCLFRRSNEKVAIFIEYRIRLLVLQVVLGLSIVV